VTKPQIRVLITDDHPFIRRELVGLLNNLPDIVIAGEAADGLEAISLARQLMPDIIIMDYSMPAMNGIDATRIIREENPQVQVIMLSMFQEAEIGEASRKAGATAFVSKIEAPERLLAAIRDCRSSIESRAHAPCL
jgi:DNA-binding NarL/FixJ family response regulator